MGFVKTIEWVNPGEEEIIWVCPEEEIVWGTQLVVHEYEVAVFFRDGKAYDVLGPGRHTLTTQNLPLLTRLLKKLGIFDEKSPFRAKIVFVSMKQFQGRFGGRTQSQELAPIMFHGTFWFKVEDPKLFITQVVGGQGLYTARQVSNFVRGYLNEGIIEELARFGIVDVFTNLSKVTRKLKARLLDRFRRLGLELLDIRFEGVDTTEEWRQRLFWMRQAGVQAALTAEAYRSFVQAAGKLGEGTGGQAAGLGMGLMMPMFFGMAPGATPYAAPVAPAVKAKTKICPRCKREVPIDAKFCPYCGFKFE